jgi:hypothetical protein
LLVRVVPWFAVAACAALIVVLAQSQRSLTHNSVFGTATMQTPRKRQPMTASHTATRRR